MPSPLSLLYQLGLYSTHKSFVIIQQCSWHFHQWIHVKGPFSLFIHMKQLHVRSSCAMGPRLFSPHLQAPLVTLVPLLSYHICSYLLHSGHESLSHQWWNRVLCRFCWCPYCAFPHESLMVVIASRIVKTFDWLCPDPSHGSPCMALVIPCEKLKLLLGLRAPERLLCQHSHFTALKPWS